MERDKIQPVTSSAIRPMTRDDTPKKQQPKPTKKRPPQKPRADGVEIQHKPKS